MFSCIYFTVASYLAWLSCPYPDWYLETHGRMWRFGMKHRGCAGSLHLEQSCSVHKLMFSGKKKLRVEDISHIHPTVLLGRCDVHPQISNWWLIWCWWSWNQLLLSCGEAVFMKVILSSVLNLQTPHQTQIWLNMQGTVLTECSGGSGLCWFGFHGPIRKINPEEET